MNRCPHCGKIFSRRITLSQRLKHINEAHPEIRYVLKSTEQAAGYASRTTFVSNTFANKEKS